MRGETLEDPLALKRGKSADETIARFHALPPGRFSPLLAAAEAATRSTPDLDFGASLGLLISGLRRSTMEAHRDDS